MRSIDRHPAYRVTDQLFLWLLTEPARPVLVGEINTVRAPRGVSLRYDATWLARGFSLSEDLPLVDQEFFPKEKDMAAGAVDDGRPDRWGERIIRFLDKPPRLSLLEYLYFAGDERFGALGVSDLDDHVRASYLSLNKRSAMVGLRQLIAHQSAKIALRILSSSEGIQAWMLPDNKTTR